MSNIVIYDEKRQKLTGISFVRDVKKQVKIRDVNNEYETIKRSSLIFAEASNLLGIKEPISDINKRDLLEMILSRFKSLSWDEVAYALKMERYGEFGARTQSYGLFNSVYVSDVLEKYISWKRKMMVEHEIPFSIEVNEPEVSDEEKQYWINLGVTNCLNFFMDKHFVENGRIHVYDVLYDEYLPKDREYKEKIKKSAMECIEVEQSLKKPHTRGESKQIKELLERAKNPNDGIVILKCKQLVLEEFFRNLVNDEKSLIEFREKFRPIGNY